MTEHALFARYAGPADAPLKVALSYIGDHFALATNCSRLREEIDRKLTPFIAEGPQPGAPLVTVTALRAPVEEEDVALLLREGRPVAVDTSLYAEQASQGRRVDAGGNYAFLIEKTGTLLLFQPSAGHVRLVNPSEEMLTLDTLRLVKSLVSLHAERRGYLMLHASGAVLQGERGVLFLGDSRNGKTTILLEVMSRFRADMLSCDTCVLRMEGGRLISRGWPSNFSVSIGTMFDYPALFPFLPEDARTLTYRQAWDIYSKHVLDSKDVVASLSVPIVPEYPVHALVCLNFDPAARTDIRPLREPAEIATWLRRVYLGSRDPIYPNWHELWTIEPAQIDANIDRFAQEIVSGGVAVYQMDWAPGPESLLRRIDMLDASHRSTDAIRGGGRRA